MEITFDPAKNERNLRLRGLGFDMVGDFDFGSAIFDEDRRRDYGEIRTRALGRIGDTLYAVVFTIRDDKLRVISLRRANRKERDRYARFKA